MGDAGARRDAPGRPNFVTRTALKGGKPTVLVVDDNTDAVEALAQILEYEGYAVATAYDGREALDYLGGHPPPDLIVLDLMMPVMNGWELRAELAKVPAFAKVPIVVMTALAEAAEIEADAIVAKPIDLKRLLLIMDRLLARRADTDGSMSRA
ncbi:MAG: response regulator [Candidatus Binataceae bacterium]